MKAHFLTRPAVIGFLLLLAAHPAVADWPMHRGNLERTGNVDGKPGPVKPQVLWAHAAQTQFVSSPAVSDKAIYLSGLNAFNSGSFYAFATEAKPAKRVLWSKQPPFLRMPAVSSPVLVQNLVLFGDGMHQTSGASLYCLKADTGFPLWQFSVPGNLVHMEGGPAVAGGKVYIGAGSGGVICVELNKVTLEGKEYDLKGAEAQLHKAWKDLEKKYEADKKKDPDLAVPPTEGALPQPRPKLVWQKGKD
jgi:hypothetical protein